MRNQARENGENGRSESGRRALRKSLRDGTRKKRKEETESEVARSEKDMDERK